MGESIISQRLRRLREDGEAEIVTGWQGRLLRPAGQDRREREFVPMDVEQETKEFGEVDGRPSFSSKREVVLAIADANAGPFENIVSRGWLARSGEDEEIRAIRFETGMRYRSLVEGAQVSALQGQGYEPRARGGEGKVASDHAIDCMKRLAAIREAIPSAVLDPTHAVVVEDRWIWEGKKGGAVAKEVGRVLRGLDHLAARFGYLTADAVSARWPST